MTLNEAATPFGDAILARSDALARHSDVVASDVPAGAPRPLTVTYLTPAHQACAADLLRWMREDGFDEAGIDAVGNVVGLYRGTDPAAPRLLTGSHYDTVRNAGRYDGRLGIFVPMACVRELVRQGRRLPFDLEVVGFAEEEGQRFPATFIGSGALAGQFDPAWLALRDADGVTMREAMAAAGHDPAAVAALRRDPSKYRGFIEVHIEQGPVLSTAGVPLGVVTAINGSVRFVGEMTGVACHAGTTPMGQRRDAATGVAELALYVERRAAQVPLLVGTVGQMQVPDGSINVVPGRCRFSLDLRAPSDGLRDALVADVLAELAAIAARRGLSYTLKETMRASAAPSDPALKRRWERAVAATGTPVFHLPSGAGHDAMKLHEAMPQAMLFLRGDNDGISHNPLEAINAADTQLAVEAFLHFLAQLAEATPS
jgi:N-carbamoyl-L-amino-acid hydrolase